MRDVDSRQTALFRLRADGFVPNSQEASGATLCDAAARFETNVTIPSRPTWINYSGGDTFHSTRNRCRGIRARAYPGLDNPNGTDDPAPGSSPRQGIGAITRSAAGHFHGIPGKTRASAAKIPGRRPAGLWVASDGRLFNGEVRDNIAFLPL